MPLICKRKKKFHFYWISVMLFITTLMVAVANLPSDGAESLENFKVLKRKSEKFFTSG